MAPIHNSIARIAHLIRYFMLFGAITFVGYAKQVHDNLFIYLIAPPLYLAYQLHEILTRHLMGGAPALPEPVRYFALLLPVTVIYYGFVGFLLKKLWNEKGAIRFLSLLLYFGFVGFIHYFAGSYLLGYLAAG